MPHKRNSNKKPISGDDHEHLTKKNVHVILIHSNGCGYCTQLMPEWDRMEDIVQKDDGLNQQCEVVKIESAEVDDKIEKYKALIGHRDIPINGYPTIVSIKGGKLHSYKEERSAEALVNWIRKLASQREYTGGKKSRRKRRKRSGCKSCKSGRLFSFW
jgi:hypothetical protein